MLGINIFSPTAPFAVYNKSLQDERLNRVVCKIGLKFYIASELVKKTYPIAYLFLWPYWSHF